MFFYDRINFVNVSETDISMTVRKNGMTSLVEVSRITEIGATGGGPAPPDDLKT